MDSCLVLLTKVFPFDKGEEFIEDELPLLARSFHQIILIATSTASNAQQTRAVPENVTVLRVPAENLQRQLPRTALRLLFSRSMNGFAGQEERHAAHSSLRTWAFLYYFVAKSELVFEDCRRLLLPYHLEQFDRVTFYAYWFYDVAVAASQLKKFCTAKSCRAVCRAHGYDLYQERQPGGFLPLRPYLLKNLDAIYPCSKDGTRYIIQHWPGFEDKLHTAYLGTQDYGIGPEPNDDVFHIVSCCHIVPLKRVELLAQALTLLEDSGLKLRWTHIGGGDALEDLRTFAKEHLSFMETNLRGSLPNAELMQFYQHTPVDLFVNTSSSEGLPVSIMEAFSFGIPAVATNVGGTSEMVRTGETGRLLPADLSPETLATALREMAAHSVQEKQRLRQSCRTLWENSFQAARNFEKFAQEIQPQETIK